MKHQHDPKTHIHNGSREAVQTSALMSDLDRIVRIIDDDIACGEKEAGVFDRSNPAYPVLATMLRARRDNLANTISLLERRLATLLERTDQLMVGDAQQARFRSAGAKSNNCVSAVKSSTDPLVDDHLDVPANSAA